MGENGFQILSEGELELSRNGDIGNPGYSRQERHGALMSLKLCGGWAWLSVTRDTPKDPPEWGRGWKRA